jgi:hypothetical protein
MSKNQFPLAFALLFLFFLVAPLQNKIQAQPRYPVIKAANTAEEIYALRKKNRRMSAAALAAYGNALIKKKGYDFSTQDCAIAEANGKNSERDDTNYETEIAFKYDLEILRRGTMSFQIMAKSWGAPCGCNFDLPVLQVSENQWTVFASGKSIILRRPKNFYFEEVKLLDKTFKKTLKTFYKPIDNEVFGVSPDGTKIYTQLSYNDDLDVMLEISDRGAFQIVPRNIGNVIKKTVELTAEQTEQDEAYSEIHHFKSKNKSYFLKYDAPCT